MASSPPGDRASGSLARPPQQLSDRGRRTRDALVAAARQVFERDGYLSARITDIAEAAGAAHGSFYTYFDSKVAVFRAVILQLEGELLGVSAAQYQGRASGDPVTRLRLANRRYLETYRANSRLMVIWEHVAAVEPDLGALLQEAKAAFVGRAETSIAHLQDAGLADRSVQPRYAAHALTGMVSRFAYTWCTEGQDFDLDTAVDELTALWARAIGLSLPDGPSMTDGPRQTDPRQTEGKQ